MSSTDGTSGTGSGLPTYILALATVCAVAATLSSLLSIYLQLTNYRASTVWRIALIEQARSRCNGASIPATPR